MNDTQKAAIALQPIHDSIASTPENTVIYAAGTLFYMSDDDIDSLVEINAARLPEPSELITPEPTSEPVPEPTSEPTPEPAA
jgi:hypothetical protein